MRRKISGYFKDLEHFLGYTPIQVTTPILNKIETLEIGILFVNLIFSLIKALLVVISVLIIYSMLLTNVESKIFQIAVIRMVGLRK